MYTYHLQQRTLKITKGDAIELPNKLSIEVKFGPPEAFGTSTEPSRLVMGGEGHTTDFIINANTGRVLARSIPPLEALQAHTEVNESQFDLEGDTLRYSAECKNDSELQSILASFVFGLPSLLNVGFADPPIILSFACQIGRAEFRLEYSKARIPIAATTPEKIQAHVAESFKRLEFIRRSDNDRLAAALYYFYTASRLMVVGISEWEFMAEIVLNLCKVLQILFGNEMDDVRAGLGRLGFTEEEIERRYIPLMVLRNHFDVGHPQLAVPRQEQLQVLYQYLGMIEIHYRDLFQRLFERISERDFGLQQPGGLNLAKEEQKKFDRLIDSIKPRQ